MGLGFADHIFFAYCRLQIGDPNIFSDIKLLQIDKYIIFLLTNTSLKVLTSDLKVVGNEKRGGSGSKLLLEYSFGPWRSMSV